jgi:3-dehydroquinate dehydratase-2
MHKSEGNEEKRVQLTRSVPIRVFVIHGPNLNMLGVRDPDVYGKDTFEEVNRKIQAHGQHLGLELNIQQSNSEGAIIDFVQEAMSWANVIVINPGAYTHYSYAIRDALADTRLPVIEVHLTNVHAREDFRRHSVVSPIATGQIVGFGTHSYLMALDAAKTLVEESHR